MTGGRNARVPEGATPRFRTEDGKQTLIIEFDGVEDEPVRVNIAQAFPLSGSELTVPHLHLWRRLTDRSMFDMPGTKGGFFKETGLTLEQALALKWDGTDPELKVGGLPASNPKEAFDGRRAGDTAPALLGEEASEATQQDREFWRRECLKPGKLAVWGRTFPCCGHEATPSGSRSPREPSCQTCDRDCGARAG